MTDDESSSSSSSAGDSDRRRRLSAEELRQLHLTCAINACGATFENKKALSAHTRSVHRPVAGVVAWHCLAAGCTDKVYTRKGNLQAHIKQTHEQIAFLCQVASCAKSYHRRAHLKRHWLSVHRCDSCELSFDDKAARDLHRRDLHSAASSTPRKRAASPSPPVSVFAGLEPPPALPVASTATIGKPESVVAAELLLSHAAKHARLGAGDDADDINDDDDDSAAAVATNIRRPVSLETAATLAIFEKFE